MVLDIDATVEGREPNLELIKNLAIECRMPFCYGGGVTTVDQAKNIIKLGAEKVALSSAAINDTSLLRKMGEAVGSQSVVVVIDVKKKKGLLGKTTYEIYTKNGREKSGKKLENFLKELNDIGVGEIVINSIDRDGTMEGYDNTLVKLVRDAVDIPITILGGAGSHEDIKSLIKDYKIIGAAAGSLFVFKGKYRAVLINYPNRIEKRNILNNQ